MPSWKVAMMKNRPGAWREQPAADASDAPTPSPGRYADPFDFMALPYDMQEYVLRFVTVVGLCRCRSVCAGMVVVYEGVMSTEFARVAGRGKPAFNRVADEFQFLYRLRRLDQPAQATPLLLWAAARDQHVLIKRVLAQSLGKPIRPARRGSLVEEAMGLGGMGYGLGGGIGMGGGGVLDDSTMLEDVAVAGAGDRYQHEASALGGAGTITVESLRGPGGITPLHVACRNDHMAAVRELMKAGADVMACDNKQQTPFYHACALGAGPATNAVRTIVRHFDFLRRAVARTNSARDSTDSFLSMTASRGFVAPPKSIDLNMTNQDGKTALYAAAERGHHGICRLLMIAGGHDVAKDARGGVALEEDRTLPVVAKLDLERGTREATPLGIACATGKVKTAALLLACGANVNGCGRDSGEWQTPVFLAAENGHVAVIEMLLEQCAPGSSSAPRHDGDRRSFAPPSDLTRCDLDYASKTGKTPLFIASEKGQIACVRVLAEAGADVSKTTFLNKSPLYIACEMGMGSIVQILLRYSTREDVLMETSYQTSAAFIAQRNGFLRIKMQLTDFLTSTKKESKVVSYSRVERARQKAYMSKLTTKYQKLEKLKAAKTEAVRAGKGGYLTKEDEVKDLEQVDRQLKKAREQLDKAAAMSAGAATRGGGRAKTKKELRDAMPQGDIVRKWDGSAASGRGSERVPGARGGKRGRKKSSGGANGAKVNGSSMQTKRRGSVYEQTGNSNQRRRSLSRPKSKPEVPTQQPRGVGHEKRSVSRAQTHVKNAKMYRDQSADDDADLSELEEEEMKPRRSRSAQDCVPSVRRSKRGWHGEGGLTSEDDYSEIDEDADKEVSQSREGGFEEEENIERELADFTAQLDDLDGQEGIIHRQETEEEEEEEEEEEGEVIKQQEAVNVPQHSRSTHVGVDKSTRKKSKEPNDADARRARAAAAAEARERALRQQRAQIGAAARDVVESAASTNAATTVGTQKKENHDRSRASPRAPQEAKRKSAPPAAPPTTSVTNSAAAAAAARRKERKERKPRGRYGKPMPQEHKASLQADALDKYSDDDFEEPGDTPKRVDKTDDLEQSRRNKKVAELSRRKQPQKPAHQKKKNSRPSNTSNMTMARSQQVYGKMYSKAYQAPNNSEKRAQSGRPTINTNGQVEVLELPPPQSPARTACKSPRGGWHHDDEKKEKKRSLQDAAGSDEGDASAPESGGEVGVEEEEESGPEDARALTQAVFHCLQGRSLSSIHRCLLRFSRSTSGFLISPSLLAYVFGAAQQDVQAVFQKLSGDVSAKGTGSSEAIDAFECFVATTMLASASLEDRLRFCFGLFDREGTNRLSRRHVGMLIRCCLTSVAKIHFVQESANALSEMTAGKKITKMVEEVFAIKSSSTHKSKGGSETVSAKQFAKWARGYRGGVPAPFVVGLLELQNAMAGDKN